MRLDVWEFSGRAEIPLSRRPGEVVPLAGGQPHGVHPRPPTWWDVALEISRDPVRKDDRSRRGDNGVRALPRSDRIGNRHQSDPDRFARMIVQPLGSPLRSSLYGEFLECASEERFYRHILDSHLLRLLKQRSSVEAYVSPPIAGVDSMSARAWIEGDSLEKMVSRRFPLQD